MNSFETKLSSLLQKNAVVYQFLRFSCIGFLNAGLNFLVVNTISKFLNISQGLPYGIIVGVGFVCAVLQSYPWNRTWAFGSQDTVAMWKNIVRLFLVGLLGCSTLLFILLASRASIPAMYYLISLIVYLILENFLWQYFGFHKSGTGHVGHSFAAFFIVTIIGFFILSGLSAVLSTHIHLTNSDLDKNIATALAILVSLVWNFIGYKVAVFKK